MKNVKLTIAYDGTRYLGWQKTSTGASIEGSLQLVLEQVLRHPIVLQAASRTDAGVHAHGQVVNFFCEKEEINLCKLSHSLNALLDHDIRVVKADIERDSFHPTLDCTHKEYRYRLCYAPTQYPHERHHTWHFPYPLDIEAMENAAKQLIGTHDFKAFCNDRKNLNYSSTVRTINAITIVPDDHQQLTIIVNGNSFLYKMVRNIVGTLAYVGAGKLSAEDIPLLLQNKKRTEAGITAPAHGLTLHQLYY